MAILIDDPNYGKTGEIDETFKPALEKELKDRFGEVTVDDADFGPGASSVGYFIEILNLVALGLALFAAPSVLRDNAKIWKSLFDKLTALLRDKTLHYYIDTESARCLALFYVLNRIGGGYNSIKLLSLMRHSANMVPKVMDVTDEAPKALREMGPRESHLQAVDQALCRYVACVEVDINCFTVVIEGNGRCDYVEPIFQR